jgi:[CysO sulfur-carrier protein]-thiocarboxylate-dependent cysteine synthase
MAVVSSVLDLIGNTPLVDVSALSPAPGVRILAKLEGQNPGGSVKDRIAWAMVQAAEADGTLAPGRTLIEPSSGNTGIALAMIARMRGYPIKIVMPENVSDERRQALEVWGAEIILTPGDEGSNGAVRRAQQLADENPQWAFLYQYGNEANPRVHYETTGPEIWRDCPEITHFVAGLGTSGTLMGVGRFLKEQNPDVRVVAIEPPLGERVEGLRNLDEGYIPPVYEKWGGPDLLDRKRIVRPRESIEWTRRLAEVGVFSGISGGAALAGAAKVASEIGGAGGRADGETGAEAEVQATIVVILADAGWKYLSTGAWTGDIDEVAALAERLIVF